jgi:NAD(P)-dependent dehydrogenase (short-subunit alcohol dehydrogenase family)
VLEINLLGSVQLCRAAVPALARRGGGAIALIGAQAWAQAPDTPQLAYAASKGALISAMIGMAGELGPKKIRVNTIVPSFMWGPPVEGYVRWQAEQRGVSEREVKAEIEKKFPLGEIPADDDVAEVVVLFCSERMRMVTGQYLRVDAGEKMG